MCFCHFHRLFFKMSGCEHPWESGYDNHLMSLSLSHLRSPGDRIPKTQTPRGYSLLPPPEVGCVCVWYLSQIKIWLPIEEQLKIWINKGCFFLPLPLPPQLTHISAHCELSYGPLYVAPNSQGCTANCHKQTSWDLLRWGGGDHRVDHSVDWTQLGPGAGRTQNANRIQISPRGKRRS